MTPARPARGRSARDVECSRRARLRTAGLLAPMPGPAAASRTPQATTSRRAAAAADQPRRRPPWRAPKSSRFAPAKCAEGRASVTDRTGEVAREVSSRGAQARVHGVACGVPAVQPANTPTSSSCVAPRHDADKQRATLLRTPSPSEMTAQPTSGAPGSKTDEKMSPQRPRSAAPPWPVWSATTARTTGAALSEGA